VSTAIGTPVSDGRVPDGVAEFDPTRFNQR
jgi:hypothetical protein